mgnify:FL=1
MDYIALAGSSCFLGRGIRFRRIVATAFLASACSLAGLLLIPDENVRTLLSHFVLNTGMVLLCFGRGTKKEFLENWAGTYLIVIFLGGFCQFLKNIGIADNFWQQLLPAAGIMTCLNFYLVRRQQFEVHIVPVTLIHREKVLQVRGYWDSGNQLRDPYNGMPVCILSYRESQKLIQADDPVRLVPYCSLGNPDGMLWVCLIDGIRINCGHRVVERKPAEIGIAENGLLEKKEYDLILHASMLEKRFLE